MIGQNSIAGNSHSVRRACDELSRRLREGLACRAEEFLAAEPTIRTDTDAALELLRRVVVSHLDTSRLAIPLMRRGSLLVEVTEGDTLFMGGMSTIGTLAKILQKVSAFVLGQELKGKRIAVPQGTATAQGLNQVLQEAGLPRDAVMRVNANYGNMGQMLI